MGSGFSCIFYKGEGKQLKKIKERTKKQTPKSISFVRISTCQRVEIYSDSELNEISKTKFLNSRDSIQHLIELLSGVDSGLFGEIEIYLQAKEAVQKAREENHLSKRMENIFSAAFSAADQIRKKYQLNNSWINSVKKAVSKNKNIFVYGDGNLATELKKSLEENERFSLSQKPEEADAIIILRRGIQLPENSANMKIINLTEDEFEEEEMKMKEFFTRPDENTVQQIKEDIKNIILQPHPLEQTPLIHAK